MIKDLAVKWHSREVGEAMNAASLLAEVLVQAGKYGQAFSPAWCERPRSPGIAFNRISNTPIKLHCDVEHVQVDILLDMQSLKYTDLKEGFTDNTVYILYSSLESEYIKEKFNIENNKVITITPGNYIFDYIPAMTTLVQETGMLDTGVFLDILTGILLRKHDSEMVSEVVKQLDELLTQVKEE